MAAVHASGAESWDDDFVFNPGTPQGAKGRTWKTLAKASTPPRMTATGSGDMDDTVRASPRQQSPALPTWAEPGPSTPPKRSFLQTEENWDDDYEVRTNTPATQKTDSRKQSAQPKQVASEPENWDDDFAEEEQQNNEGGKGDWDSSDEEDGFGDIEDRTVTSRTRKNLVAKHSPPPPVPSIPSAFARPPPTYPPGSPALSQFSIPASSNPRDSIGYSSLSHMPLRAGSTSALARLPPSPPMQRERRRLRKKSRPPDANVFELLEHSGDVPEITSPPQAVPPELPPVFTPHENGQQKTNILVRVNSLKKWGNRKKRSSGAAEVAEMEATPRASTSQQASNGSSPASRQSSGWFFRGSGGQGAEYVSGSPPVTDTSPLKHERSITRLRAFSYALDSPTKKGKQPAAIIGKQNGMRPETPGPQGGSPGSSPRRRPMSMQMPPSSDIKAPFPRQASHGPMFYGAASSRSTFSASTDEVHLQSSNGSQEGHRSFMQNIRRISLVGKHKRNKSSVAPPVISPAPPMPQLPVSSPLDHDELLPPIELQPPSPPRVGQSREASEDTIVSTANTDTTDEGSSLSLLLRPSFDASQSVPALTSPSSPVLATPRSSPKTSSGTPSSPQSASLGRSAQLSSNSSTTIVPRRNSLGDLKIPARISQVQVNLKRDLNMVREFATSVEKLKQLHDLYNSLTRDAEVTIAEHAAASRPPSRAMSPTAIFKPLARSRSNTNPDQSDPHNQFALAFYSIEAKYKISWECAELLVELGSGSVPPPSTPATPLLPPAPELRKSRERAITLAGDEPQPQSPVAGNSSSQLGWRASTGRNDLSARQLNLLKEMLNKDTTGQGQIPEEAVMIVNRNWRWGADAMGSTVTLPSEESSARSSRDASPPKKRRSSRMGMRGLRDMLKSLARNSGSSSSSSRFNVSSASPTMSTDSSLNTHGLPVPPGSVNSLHQRTAKSSTGPESTSSLSHTTSPPHAQSFGVYKSPRRPSIASIFRFANKSKTSSPTLEAKPLPSADTENAEQSAESEEDWDRVEDFDTAADAFGTSQDGGATVRGRKSRSPYGQHGEQPATPKKAHSSRSSLSLRQTEGSAPIPPLLPAPTSSISTLPIVPASALPPHTLAFTRPTRLSNVEEAAEHSGAEDAAQLALKRVSRARPSQSPRRPPSRGSGVMVASATGSRRLHGSGSARSTAPPPTTTSPTTKLAMTPENIKPLLESAREVHSRCTACIDEMHALLVAKPAVSSPLPSAP